MSDGEGASATASGGAVPAPALYSDRRRAAWATLISIVVPVLTGLFIRSTPLMEGHEFAAPS